MSRYLSRAYWLESITCAELELNDSRRFTLRCTRLLRLAIVAGLIAWAILPWT